MNEEPKKERPVKEFRIGGLKAAVWNGNSHHANVSLSRSYMEKDGRWVTVRSFRRRDLLELAKLIDRVHSYLLDRHASDQESRDET
jgi:hypothetical protein